VIIWCATQVYEREERSPHLKSNKGLRRRRRRRRRRRKVHHNQSIDYNQL